LGYLVCPNSIAINPAICKFGSLINAVINSDKEAIPFANFGEAPIRIQKDTLLGTLQAYIPPPKMVESFLNIADIFQGLPPIAPDNPEGKYPSGYPFLIDPPKDPKADFEKADISGHWGEEFTSKIRAVIVEHTDLFREGLGCFNNEITMPIPFKDGTSVSDLKQTPYSLSLKDRRAMDEILDPLKAAGVIEDVPLGEPSPVASPAFVIWRDGKARVIVDLRRVNTKLHLDAYPLPKQEDIFAQIGGAVIFSILDIVKSFFQ
jgi:hypothetical protein